MKRRHRHSAGEDGKVNWKKSWREIQCSNCSEIVIVSNDTVKVLCPKCVISDPYGFMVFSGKPWKNFKMAMKYLIQTSGKKLQPVQVDSTLSNQDGQKQPKTFASWIKRYREKEAEKKRK